MSDLPPAVTEAIEWYAQRTSGHFDESAQRALEAWLAADVSHRQAWVALQQRLARTLGPLAERQGTTQALRASHGRRHLLRGALGLGALAVGTQLLTVPGAPLHARWGADLRTASAQRKTFRLEDGSSLLLNAESSADIDVHATARRVSLLRGALMATVQQDLARPFVLACPWGESRLYGGACVLSMQARQPQLWALDGPLELQAPLQRTTLQAGQGVAFDGQLWQPIAPRHIDQRSWVRGLLEVHDQSLASVIEHLRPYHRGILQVAPEVAELRISGVFSLDDSRAALHALRDMLPLRITHYLGYWTRIEHA
ncbi:FecR domain-containing protein [Pseudomonas cremoricolorata]|uniref:FecR domain-containing protein n=1 Tax=Pseudomonas cremoricolorata TaxID=157783 RepID=UPI000534185F|nr:FecR domain-containing protein [Pseudomonas cremoricolorata]